MLFFNRKDTSKRTQYMQQKVQTYIQKQQLLTPNGPVIVGVSGGADSIALLHILISLGYDCIVAHCNFHLRMEESKRDETFVRKLAHSYSIPYYSIDFETTKYAESHKISIEMAARNLRYEWFGKLLEKLGAQAIVVAHHADDSIETLLMNLVRGTGIRGLTGIPIHNNKVVRPLLCCNRMELENYLTENKLQHVEDSTNQTNNYLRNRFRNEVLPLLIEINPSARKNLYKSIENLEGNLAIYQQSIEEIQKLIVDKTSEIIKMDINLIKSQVHIPTVMYELLSPYGFNPPVIEQITESLDGESGKVFFSETHRLVKDRKYLIINTKYANTKETYSISQTDGEITYPIRLKIKKLSVTSEFQVSKLQNCIHVDASKIIFPLVLRHWNQGDIFFPFGMKQRKKISDFFIDNRMSIAEKEQCWLLASGSDILWIVGYRTDDRFKVTNETKEVLEISIK
jgi:tRNA(Ile)-lysidine synthase